MARNSDSVVVVVVVVDVVVVVEDESPEASKSVESRKTDMKQITDIGLPRSFAAEKLYLELELAWARA